MNKLLTIGLPLLDLANATPFPALALRDASSSSGHEARAVYIMTNPYLAPNSVVAMAVAQDGTLSNPVFTATGGNGGGDLMNMATGKPGGPDALASQGSLRVADNFLFVTNAGSNTLSMFEISHKDPTSLTLLGTPKNTGGEIPVSVTVSKKLKTVCVGNSAGTGGASCASFDRNHGLGDFDAIRPFNHNAGPVNALGGLSQILFTADSEELIAVVAGNGTAANPNRYITYAVDMKTRQIARSGLVADTGKTGHAFGVALVPKTDRLLVSTVSFGATTVSIKDLSVPLTITNITDQKASCWATVSSFSRTGFVADAVVPQLTEVNLSTGAILKELKVNTGSGGLFDLEAAGTKIYALSPGNGSSPAEVIVVDISGGAGAAKQMQRFVVDKVMQDAEGMGVFPNPGELTG